MGRRELQNISSLGSEVWLALGSIPCPSLTLPGIARNYISQIPLQVIKVQQMGTIGGGQKGKMREKPGHFCPLSLP
jgi:hypothetical protein